MRVRGRPDDRNDVTLITDAPVSLDDQHDARRRKYLTMMSLRVVCLLAAVAVANISLWLSLAFLLGGVVLPWCAVLIANDRPPKKAGQVSRYTAPTSTRALPRAGSVEDQPHRPTS